MSTSQSLLNSSRMWMVSASLLGLLALPLAASSPAGEGDGPTSQATDGNVRAVVVTSVRSIDANKRVIARPIARTSSRGAARAVPAAAAPTASESTAGAITVYAERAYTAPGKVVEKAAVRVEDGKIVSVVGGVDPPKSASLRAQALTAGMIDLSIQINGGSSSVEQVTEVQPHRRVTDSLNFYDPAWKLQLERGVTAALVAPDDRNVIGGLCAVVKTGGEPNLAARLVKQDACVRGAIGTGPSSGNSPARGRPRNFYARRPTTRMGVEWEWRKAFYDAEAAPRVPEKEFDGAQVLRDVLAGKHTLNIEAWATQDIRTAVFLKEELAGQGLGEIRLVLDSAAEAWKEPDLVVRSGAMVVLPPFAINGRTTDSAFMAWDVARKLIDLGVPVALSAHGARAASSRLSIQAAWARRGGLTFDEALATVTTTPALIAGVQDRVGSVEVGKDADLVLWNGQPFELTSTVVGVVLDGELVKDPRD